uniref:Uncharacterized protein n=1 Tax=Phakopsora pachyrhizi TaxID=170000 RepID=A0A0S1MKE1_PHAPC
MSPLMNLGTCTSTSLHLILLSSTSTNLRSDWLSKV